MQLNVIYWLLKKCFSIGLLILLLTNKVKQNKERGKYTARTYIFIYLLYIYNYNLYLVKMWNDNVFHTVLAFFSSVLMTFLNYHLQLFHQPLSTLSH